MSKGTWFTVMFIKNLILFSVMLILLLVFLDTPRLELERMLGAYEYLTDGMKVIFITGLSTVPLVLTWWESMLVDWLHNRGVLNAKV